MTYVAFDIEKLAKILEENNKPNVPGAARSYTGYLHLLSKAAGFKSYNAVVAESERISEFTASSPNSEPLAKKSSEGSTAKWPNNHLNPQLP